MMAQLPPGPLPPLGVEQSLLRLIDTAERAITARPFGTDVDRLVDVVADIRMPVGVIFSGAHDLLIDALVIADRHARRDAMRSRWLMIIGALIPMVRDDLAACLEARRQPLERDPTDVGLSRRGA